MTGKGKGAAAAGATSPGPATASYGGTGGNGRGARGGRVSEAAAVSRSPSALAGGGIALGGLTSGVTGGCRGAAGAGAVSPRPTTAAAATRRTGGAADAASPVRAAWKENIPSGTAGATLASAGLGTPQVCNNPSPSMSRSTWGMGGRAVLSLMPTVASLSGKNGNAGPNQTGPGQERGAVDGGASSEQATSSAHDS